MGPERRATILAPATLFEQAEKWESLSGGTTTNHQRYDRDAFSQPASNLSFEERSSFSIGNGLFRKLWVLGPGPIENDDFRPSFVDSMPWLISEFLRRYLPSRHPRPGFRTQFPRDLARW